MKTAARIRIVALAGLVVAISGVVAAHAFSRGHVARPRVGKVVARIPIPPNSGVLAIGEGAVWTTSGTDPGPHRSGHELHRRPHPGRVEEPMSGASRKLR